ncbi:MAG: ABC transporter substrate-binding protein [Candidatus Methanospirareceae archaeon]
MKSGKVIWTSGRWWYRRAGWRRCVLSGLIAFVCVFIFFASISANSIDLHKGADAHRFTLQIYGNANEDDTIDMRDVTYIKLVIFRKKPETRFCDANYDGKISGLDVVQTKLIILGKEAKLTFIDCNGDDITVSKPLKRIIVLNTDAAEAVRVLGAKERVIGVCKGITEKSLFFPYLSKQQSVGKWSSPDVERIIALDPDAVFAYGRWPGPDKLEDKLTGTDIVVIRLDFYKMDTLRGEMNILGYLLDAEEDARAYLEWFDDIVGKIDERVSTLSEDEKPKVFLASTYKIEEVETEIKAYGRGSGMHSLCERAGGKNIAAEQEGAYPKVEVEWVLFQNPDVIVGLSYKGGYETDDDSKMASQYEKIIELLNITNAVKNNRVHLIEGDVAFSPVMPVGLAYFAKWLHPDLFADLDPQAIHQEYIDRFCGIDYDVAEHGVFVYP